MSRKRNKGKKKISILMGIILIVIIPILLIGYKINYDKNIELEQGRLVQDIKKHYNKYVITNKDADIYMKGNSKYEKVGVIGKDQELVIGDKDITYNDTYFKIDNMEKEYYIYYKDVEITDELSNKNDDRYKKYIVFNKNIVTKDKTSFYDEDNNLIYRFNKSFNLPIIINEDNRYGVEYNNRLLYIKRDDVLKVEDSKNTDNSNTKEIAVLNYHFFYDNNKSGESAKCNQIICLSTDNLRKHLDYIKDKKIFTPTMKELEMYIDGFIQLPKSVVLTIDDGWRADIGSKIMNEYGLNATVFLVSNDYDPKSYKSEYIEVHSHGHNLHKPGICSGGQGGAIKCLDKTKLMEDLSASRKKLDNTTVFCYPFYEYNDYSINVLKETGFTMAFGGYGEGGNYRVKPGINKFKLPRYVVYSSTSAEDLASYIK